MKKLLQEVRPHLSLVSPLTAYIILGFAITNILLGWGLYQTQQGATSTSRLVVVNHVFSLAHWGVLFAVLGFVMLYGYYKNDWELLKQSLITGLFMKAVWMYALIFLAFKGGSITLLVIWAFFTYIQVLAYVFFVPRLRRDTDENI